jgi:uncharacterized protein YdeI (BOF family)
MKVTSVCVACIVLVAACSRQGGTILGKNPKGEAHTVLAIRAGDTPPEVKLTGRMVEKCPIAGCWFRLKDRTGVIKVDTKSAGFVVAKVPLETVMTVAGKIVISGDEVELEATGLRY